METMGSSGGSGGFVEELLVISGNFGVQVTYGVYMVFLNGVFLAGVNPLFFAVFANLATAAVLLPFAVVFEMKKWTRNMSAKLLSKFCLLSLGGTLFQVLSLSGIKKASPAIASAMSNLAPGLIFIIAACVGYEKFDACCRYSRAKIVGTLVCLTGATTMCFLQNSTSSGRPHLPNNWLALFTKPFTVAKAMNNHDWMLGCLYLLAGVLVLSCNTVLQAATLVQFPAPLSLVTTTSVVISFLTALLQIISQGKIDVGSSTMAIECITGIVILAGVVIGICIAFQTWCIIKKGPVLVSIFSPIQTVTSLVVSAVILGKIISLESLAGIMLMFAGLYIVLWAKKNETFCLLDVGADLLLPAVEDVEKPLLS
ncbi:hypothetical protein Cni_G14169 [Canna indica]|uniref:WAT1-related protein n=1 Tax=Canna indica TaxID=4628 RepID=A0AAQ3KBI6_9LILI|nr:hypothetical protein Cni_G14169 [Canna indica]